MVDGNLAKVVVMAAAFLQPPPPSLRPGRMPAVAHRAGLASEASLMRLWRPAARQGLVLRMAENLGDTPSWEELFDRLPLNKRRALKQGPPKEEAGEGPVILFRDSAGECPDCARVWLALLEKGVAFDEKLVAAGGEEAYPAILWD
ncbi:hypothetical protein T484DRAFT_1783572, partial [Baffinella frigidus]